MPLDAIKIAHIQAVIPKTYANRQKTVVFVYLASGVYSYTAVACIFRPQLIVDQEIPDLAGGPPKMPFDVLMDAPITVNFVGVQYVADTTTATSGAVAAAAKYEIIQAVPTGIVPGGTHYEVQLRRMR